MIAALSLRKLAQAVLLALAAWVLAAGVASAHGGHAGVYTRSSSESVSSLPAASQHKDIAAGRAELAEGNHAFVERSEDPCPAGNPAKHTGSCCTVACHAAMAAPAIDPWIGPRVVSPLFAALSDMLEGRCGDRSERPPRLV